ncbi:hypothetical protein LTS18_001734 [Coniosporium uncinatum]|uniref:Uncharacterized protein n=1 Tax=Coniosporium uncinatum TaxID=93489 RepID=A0ACC3DC55_9PEZI|nr:hypothetical protein LTS18_001734 [Coniosporium uncinatum]
MQYSKMLWLVAGLATTALAQQSSSSTSYDGDCDGSNDPPSCMSSLMASTSSSLGPRQSVVTIVTTDVGTLVTTDVGTSRYVTSLPPSILTYTTEIAAGTTLVPVLTPSVVSSEVVVTTNTAGQSTTSTRLRTTSVTVAPSSSSMPAAAGGAASSSPSPAGAAAFATMVPAVFGAAALGLAAVL